MSTHLNMNTHNPDYKLIETASVSMAESRIL